MEAKKQAICDALRAWIEQRPGLEWCNYSTGDYAESRRAYMGDKRTIERQLRDARELLRAVEWRDSITADDMLAAFPRAFSGRLSCNVYEAGKAYTKPGGESFSYPTRTAKLDYCTGQYWPTEYRAAAAAVLASILWDRKWQDMPETLPTNDGRRTVYGSDLSPGDWLRASFRREFGATMQRRYFD